MTAVHPYDEATIDSLRACGIQKPLLDRVEILAVEAGANARARSEANHPARLLGRAQQAMRNALLRDDIDVLKADLRAALNDLMQAEVAA